MKFLRHNWPWILAAVVVAAVIYWWMRRAETADDLDATAVASGVVGHAVRQALDLNGAKRMETTLIARLVAARATGRTADATRIERQLAELNRLYPPSPSRHNAPLSASGSV